MLQKLAGFFLACGLLAAAASAAVPVPPQPFANNNGVLPQPSDYRGPLFQLNHDYPAAVPPGPADFPWRTAIGNGRITTKNAGAYLAALKAHLVADMRALTLHYDQWDAAQRGWFNEPWLGSLRESIHGLYIGSSPFSADLFPGTGLTVPFESYGLTYYDRRAAVMLHNIWGPTALNPVVDQPAAAQFPEGSIVLKLAFSSANGDVWPVLQGAVRWPLMFMSDPTDPSRNGKFGHVSLFQFDMIVKDSRSSPTTGWVFASLVYDQDAPGADVWDRMVPLGAMWGNDPAVDSSQPSPPPLTETWVNPHAPAYSTMTLGWGGRLAGPNDGALNAIAFATGPNQLVKQPAAGSSSCLSCHGVSEWPLKSFLLPALPPAPPAPAAPFSSLDDDYMVTWSPGSPGWMNWFQSRAGDVPQDAGTVAFDYDLVFTFKSLSQWSQAMQPTSPAALHPMLRHAVRPNLNYNGKSRRTPAEAK